jgi:cytochrome c-type biogenesis protein CcmE
MMMTPRTRKRLTVTGAVLGLAGLVGGLVLGAVY